MRTSHPAWAESTVGEQFDIQLGKMLDSSRNMGTTKPYLGNRAVQWRHIDVSACGLVPMSDSDIRRYRLVKGDLLVCEGGEVGRAAVWQDELPECYFQKALHRLRPKHGYSPNIMLSLLEHWAKSGYFSGQVSQTSIAHLTRDTLSRLALPVPTQAEQEVLADLVDDLHDQVSALERLIAKKQAVKQGVMQQLFAENAAIRPLSSMLGRLTAGVSVNSVAERGVFSILKTSCVSGGVFIPTEKKTIAQNEVRRARVNPVADTLIVSRMNTPNLVGEVGYVSQDWPDLYLPDRLWLATKLPGAQVNMRWLGYALSFPRNSRRIKGLATGTSGSMKNIGKGSFLDFLLSAPSLERQDFIACVLTDVDADLTTLTTRLHKARAVKQGMMQQLLTGKIRLPITDSTLED